MQPESFLDILQAPNLEGLALGVTATRALERFGSLVNNPSSLLSQQRVDVADELLDVVLADASQATGFAFTGLSLAELWDALNRDEHSEALLPAWCEFLQSNELVQLRQLARDRSVALGNCHYLGQVYLSRPWSQSGDVGAIAALSAPLYLPEQLQRIIGNLSHQKAEQARYRSAIGMVQCRVYTELQFPLQGENVEINCWGNSYNWVYWSALRLLPPLQRDGLGLADDYFELQLVLPGLEESYFSEHFMVRNCFAHVRCSLHFDLQGRRVMLLDEVQSDWVNDLRKQRQGKKYGREVSPFPYEKNWLEIAMEFFLKFASEQLRVDFIAMTPGKIQHQLQHMLPLRIAERLYDQQAPEALEKQISHCSNVIHLPVSIRSYSRDIMLVYRVDTQWTLYDSYTLDNQIVSGIETESEALKVYLQYANESIEHLQGYDIRNISHSSTELPPSNRLQSDVDLGVPPRKNPEPDNIDDATAALFAATTAGDLTAAQQALNDGANINTINQWGESPLLVATSSKHRCAKMVGFLLESGADADFRGRDNCGVLFIATLRTHSGMLDLLLENGAEPNLRMADGETLYDWAEHAYRLDHWGPDLPIDATDQDRASAQNWLAYLDRNAMLSHKPQPSHLRVLRNYGAKTLNELKHEAEATGQYLSLVWDPRYWQGMMLIALSLRITRLEAGGYAILSARVTDVDRERTVDLPVPEDILGGLRVFSTADVLIASLREVFNESQVRLHYTEESFNQPSKGAGKALCFETEFKKNQLQWHGPYPPLGKSKEKIPSGNSCQACPYYEIRENRQEQQNGYCGYLEWGDWMAASGSDAPLSCKTKICEVRKH